MAALSFLGLSSVKNNDNIGGKVEKLCHSKDAKLSSKSAKPRRYSGFNLLTSFTIKLFNAVLSSQFVIRGFRNKDLGEALLGLGAISKKLSSKITRLIAKLRAHKIITKLNKTCRYRVTKTGERLISRIIMFSKI